MQLDYGIVANDFNVLYQARDKLHFQRLEYIQLFELLFKLMQTNSFVKL